ncbi:ABC transporter [Mycoplasmatota bacterium WC30]
MRLLNLIRGDIRFQFKYGFYLLFFLFSFIYIVTVKVLPTSLWSKVGAILIFTDPTALGLVFMGAIVHFEISEKTINSLCISPISPMEYLLSKLLSIALLSTISGLLIGIFTQTINNYLSFTVGIFVGSLIFSALGLIIAFKTSSMNQFILSIIPTMIFVILPGVVYIIGLDSFWYLFHPGIAVSELIVNGSNSIYALISLLLWLYIIVLFAIKIVKNRFKNESGVF